MRGRSFLILLLISLTITEGFTQSPNAMVGAYYFDGWTGTYPYHITTALTSSFPEREPKWGWVTSSQEIMDEQINVAANAGLSFFSFCWYYKHPVLNNALGYYLKSSKNNRLKFCVMVSNHPGAEVGPNEWSYGTSEWVKLFKAPTYVTVGGKPLLIFFTISTLIKNFGSTEAVKTAFDNLRAAAKKEGLSGVNIAVCMSAGQDEIKNAEACGVDIITGYNYHSNGLTSGAVTPIENMVKAETWIWDQMPKVTKLKYIPVSTLNWDPRPWASSSNNYATAPYLTGFSAKSVFRSVQNGITWLNKNSSSTVPERILLLYAWNENGEGAYLTPCKNGENMLEGVRKALLPQIETSTKP